MGEVDRGEFNRSEVEARLALSHSLNQVGRDLEGTLAVGLGGRPQLAQLMNSGLLPDSTAVRVTSPVRAILQVMQEGLPPLATLWPPAAAQASEKVRVRRFGLVGQSWALGSADVNPVLGNQSFRLGRMRLQHAGWVSSELGRRSDFLGTHG